MELVLDEAFNTEIEICQDLVLDTEFDNKEKNHLTINTQIGFVKSLTRLTNKMEIKDPVIITPPTGLSSSFKNLKKPVKKIETPVNKPQPEPILGVSKPYTLKNTLSDNYNNKFSNASTNIEEHKIYNLEFIPI